MILNDLKPASEENVWAQKGKRRHADGTAVRKKPLVFRSRLPLRRKTLD